MPRSTYSDAQIIQSLSSKDKRSIAAILEKYGDTLYGIAYQKVKSELLASEILKQTFIAIWNQATAYNEEEGRLFNWLLKIMNQTVTNVNLCKVA